MKMVVKIGIFLKNIYLRAQQTAGVYKRSVCKKKIRLVDVSLELVCFFVLIYINLQRRLKTNIICHAVTLTIRPPATSQLCHLNYIPQQHYLASLHVSVQHPSATPDSSLLPFSPLEPSPLPLPACRLQFKAPFQLPGLTALQPS